jgi:hypothetical protein
MVILALAERLNVVASLKVIPSSGVRRGLHDVIEINVVAHFSGYEFLSRTHGRDPRHNSHVADRLDGSGLRVRGGRR